MFRLSILAGSYVIHRFGPSDPVPDSLLRQPFVSVTRTDDELSIVCSKEMLVSPSSGSVWSVLKLHGPFPLESVGVLALLSKTLADAEVSIFVISTFDTDYLLVLEAHLSRAVEALEQAGNLVEGGNRLPPGPAGR